MSNTLKLFANDTIKNITLKATNNVAKTRFFSNLKLDLTIFVNMHSNCNISDVGKPSLFEEAFANTKYPIKLSYNAYKPGISSLFHQRLLTITNRKQLKKEASLVGIYKYNVINKYNQALHTYQSYKKLSEFLNINIDSIIKTYFYDVHDLSNRIYYFKDEIKDENPDKYILVQDNRMYYLIRNNLTIDNINKIIDMINSTVKYLVDNNNIQTNAKLLENLSINIDINNNDYLRIAKNIYYLNQSIQYINKETKIYNSKVNYFNRLRNNEPSISDIKDYFGYIDKTLMDYFNEPQFKRYNRLYKQTYIGNDVYDNFIAGLYITFKQSKKLLQAISYFLSDNPDFADQIHADTFYEKYLNNALLKNEYTYLFLVYLFKKQKMVTSEVTSLFKHILKDFNNTQNTFTSGQLKLFIEAIANYIGKCTVFNIVCLSFNDKQKIDSNTNSLLTEQLKSVIISSNEASPESAESIKSGGYNNKTQKNKHRR